MSDGLMMEDWLVRGINMDSYRVRFMVGFMAASTFPPKYAFSFMLCCTGGLYGFYTLIFGLASFFI